MKTYEFISLKRMKNEDDFSKLELGEYFLYGPRMIAQIENKKPGEEISFYQVYRIEGKNVEYGVKFDILEAQKKKEDL